MDLTCVEGERVIRRERINVLTARLDKRKERILRVFKPREGSHLKHIVNTYLFALMLFRNRLNTSTGVDLVTEINYRRAAHLFIRYSNLLYQYSSFAQGESEGSYFPNPERISDGQYIRLAVKVFDGKKPTRR